MDWLKFFTESYVELIGHVAWPLTILALLLIFRKPIADKLRGLIKAGKGDTFIEFLTSDLRDKVSKKKLKLSEITEDKYTWDDYLEALERWASWASVSELLLVAYSSDKSVITSASQEVNATSHALAKLAPQSELLALAKEIHSKAQAIKKLRIAYPFQDFLKMKPS